MARPVCNSVDYRKQFSLPESPEKSGSRPIFWEGEIELNELENLFQRSGIADAEPVLGLVYVYGDWVRIPSESYGSDEKSVLNSTLESWLSPVVNGLECQILCGKIRLTEESVDSLEKIPPDELPALAICAQKPGDIRSIVEFLPLKTATLQKALWTQSKNDSAPSTVHVKEAVRAAVQSIQSKLTLAVSFQSSEDTLRIFVAGDRSSVGKSSVCLYVASRFRVSCRAEYVNTCRHHSFCFL